MEILKNGTEKEKINYFYENKIITEDGCWIQDKIKPIKRGYVKIKVHGKAKALHRLSLEEKLGRPLREGYETCHIRECPEKGCYNPEHLYEGTHPQNIEDAKELGTTKRKAARGERQHLSKLTYNKVVAIKGLLKLGIQHWKIAKIYGVHRSAITSISRGRTWTHV